MQNLVEASRHHDGNKRASGSSDGSKSSESWEPRARRTSVTPRCADRKRSDRSGRGDNSDGRVLRARSTSAFAYRAGDSDSWVPPARRLRAPSQCSRDQPFDRDIRTDVSTRVFDDSAGDPRFPAEPEEGVPRLRLHDRVSEPNRAPGCVRRRYLTNVRARVGMTLVRGRAIQLRRRGPFEAHAVRREPFDREPPFVMRTMMTRALCRVPDYAA